MNIAVGNRMPLVKWNTRVRDETVEGDNPYRWEHLTTADVFKDKRVVLFSLPGAFTPTCTTKQLPGFESLYDDFIESGVDEIYCMSVNDSFVMNAWSRWANIKNVKVIPDGSGEFTSAISMLVDKGNLTFGQRSWRFAILCNDGVIEQSWIEPGMCDNAQDDPYGETAPEKILEYIQLESPLAKGRELQLTLFEGLDSKDKMS